MTLRGPASVLIAALLAGAPLGAAAQTTIEDNQITTGDNSNVNVVGNQIINNYSQSKFEQELRDQLYQVTQALLDERTHSRDLILQQSEISRQLADVRSSYAEKVALLAEAQGKLADLGAGIEAARILEAQAAIIRGDTSKADALFAEVERMEADSIERAAEAAFERGKIAENEVRWSDAADHYARAERLAPNVARQRKAREFAMIAGRYHESVRYGEDHLYSTIDEHGEGSWEHAEALLFTGAVLMRSGAFEEAEEFIRESIRIHETGFLDSQPDLDVKLAELAVLLRYTGRMDAAEAALRDAIRIIEETGRTNVDQYPLTLNTLALVIRDRGRYGESEPIFRKSVQMARKRFGALHPSYALPLHNFSAVLRDMGRLMEAELFSRQALDIVKLTYGQEHPEVAKVMGMLGSILTQAGSFHEAEPFLTGALEIDIETIGRRHPVYAVHLSYLGELRLASGHLPEAEVLFRNAIKANLRSVGENHHFHARYLANLAEVLRMTGRIAEAKPLYAEALEIARRTAGADHPIALRIDGLQVAFLRAHYSEEPPVAKDETGGAVAVE